MKLAESNSSYLGDEEAQAMAGMVALFGITMAWWALALWPLDDAPAWLERTRYVCFGVAENGLPDAGGWIGLIAGPMGMFGILGIGWSRGLHGLLRRARTSRMIASTITTMMVGTLVMVLGAAMRVHQSRTTPPWLEEDTTLPPASYPRLDRKAPGLVLTAQNGEAFDLTSLRGQPALVTFAFSHCSTICPVLVLNTLKVQDALRGTVHEPAVVVVTVDPWRDPPSRLAGMARSWGFPETGAWVLSGTVDEVEATLNAWDLPRSRNPITGEVTHPALVYVLDREGRIAYASTGGTAALRSLIERLSHEWRGEVMP